ncbi:hypothetical protein ABHF91_12635 [Pseudaeromonas sp. ZJS20]|uniref:hypothetical protein n=1 Tax=Pseudaeromonas aegiceratis TaxID=3153928 RepID=UPI00390C70DA
MNLPWLPAGEALAARLAQHQIVALGEVHWTGQPYDWLCDWLATPGHADLLDTLVVEFGNGRHQAVLDAYLAGEAVSGAALQAVLQDALFSLTWSHPAYLRLLGCLRQLNQARPARRRIRICLAEAPFDWQAPDLAQAWQRALARREDDYYHCVQRQVLAPGRRALLLFGAFHLRRLGESQPQLAHHILDPLGARLARQLGEQIYFIWPHFTADPAVLHALSEGQGQGPRLCHLAGTPLAQRIFGQLHPRLPSSRCLGELTDGYLDLGDLPRRQQLPADWLADGTWRREIWCRARALPIDAGEALQQQLQRLGVQDN